MSSKRTDESGATSTNIRRVTLDLDSADHRALRLSSVEDDVPMADILRALVQLWRRDKDVRQRAEAVLAGQLTLGKPLRH